LATCCAVSTAACGSRARGPEPAYVAPPLAPVPEIPPWPEGLPEPEDLDDGSVVLPPALAAATAARLEHYTALPGLCAAAVEEQARRDELAARAALRLADELTEARVVEAEASGWGWWEVGLVAGAVGIVCGVLGAALGAAVVDGGPVFVTP
jgi:hypothetical protein